MPDQNKSPPNEKGGLRDVLECAAIVTTLAAALTAPLFILGMRSIREDGKRIPSIEAGFVTLAKIRKEGQKPPSVERRCECPQSPRDKPFALKQPTCVPR